MIAVLLVVVAAVVVVVVSVEASCLQGPLPLPLLPLPPFSQSGFSCLSSTGEASISTTLGPRRWPPEVADASAAATLLAAENATMTSEMSSRWTSMLKQKVKELDRRWGRVVDLPLIKDTNYDLHGNAVERAWVSSANACSFNILIVSTQSCLQIRRSTDQGRSVQVQLQRPMLLEDRGHDR